MCCLPDGLSTTGSVGTGTVMRRSRSRSYARAAGFTAVEVLDELEHDIFRFYRLVASYPTGSTRPLVPSTRTVR